MPASFRKHFPKTRVILDATEIRHGHLYIRTKIKSNLHKKFEQFA